MESFAFFSQKTGNQSTQPGLTQTGPTQSLTSQLPLRFEDLDFLFGDYSEPMDEERGECQTSSKMDIEYERLQPQVPNYQLPAQAANQQKGQLIARQCDLQEPNGSHLFFEDFLPDYSEEIQEVMVGRVGFSSVEEDDIDCLFPDLPDDPRFQFPSFKPSNREPTPLQMHHPRPQDAYQLQNYGSLAQIQPSYFPHASPFHPQPTFNPPNHPNYHQTLAIQKEHDPQFLDLFKFRQQAGQKGSIFEAYEPAGRPQTALATGIAKMVMALRSMIDTLCQTATVSKAVGHLVVSHRLTNDDVLLITGVNKRALHSRAGKCTLGKALAKLIVGITCLKLPPDQRAAVWKTIGECL